VKDLYSENYKTLLKEIKEDTSKWKHFMFMDWKNLYCYDIRTVQTDVFCRNGKIHPTIQYVISRYSQIAKTMLNKNNKFGRLILPDFRTYY